MEQTAPQKNTAAQNVQTNHGPRSGNGKTLKGIVVSDKMKDTIVVEVNTFRKVPKYGKYIQRTKRFKAHDAGNTRKVGEAVTIAETRPISKDKHFIVVAA